MAGVGQPAVERLREFLRALKPGARALLIAELERGMLRGEDMAGAELILAELRRSMHESQSKSQRIGDHARLFFNPIEPFVVDDVADHKHRGRIARSALEPIWVWLSNTVMPDEAKAFSEQVEAALLAGDTDKAQHLARAFQDSALSRMQDSARRRGQRRQGAAPDRRSTRHAARARRRQDHASACSKRATRWPCWAAQLPGHIKALTGAALENVKAQLDARLSSNPDMFIYALVLVMGRLAASWQLVRLATKAAGSDVAARIEETPYSVAVAIVLTEIARLVARAQHRSQKRPRHRGRRAAAGHPRRAARAAHRARPVRRFGLGHVSSPRSAPTYPNCFPARST